ISQNTPWEKLSGATLGVVKQAWIELLESPIAISGEVAERFAFLDTSDEAWLALYKAQEKLPTALKTKVEQASSDRCRKSPNGGVCRWQELAQLDSEKIKFQ